jgi:hypothetical protein
LGRERSEQSEQSEDENHALSVIFAIPPAPNAEPFSVIRKGHMLQVRYSGSPWRPDGAPISFKVSKYRVGRVMFGTSRALAEPAAMREGVHMRVQAYSVPVAERRGAMVRYRNVPNQYVNRCGNRFLVRPIRPDDAPKFVTASLFCRGAAMEA